MKLSSIFIFLPVITGIIGGLIGGRIYNKNKRRKDDKQQH